jgi:hypothetical protein
VGFVVDKMTLGKVFSEYFGFPCQLSVPRLLHTHHLSSGAGTIGQLMADVPSGLSLTPPPRNPTRKEEILRECTAKSAEKRFDIMSYFNIILHLLMENDRILL